MVVDIELILTITCLGLYIIKSLVKNKHHIKKGYVRLISGGSIDVEKFDSNDTINSH